MLEDIKRDPKASDADVADATRKTNVLNQERAEVVDMIDELFIGVINGEIEFKPYGYGKNKVYRNK